MNSSQAKIFIIEDEEKMRDIFKINLSKKYNISYFRDAESALKALSSNSPDLIVTDVRLPGMDGIEFMEKVRKQNRGIPFIVFTGYGSINHAVDTMKKGAFDYLVKPIKIKNLIQSIERALSYIEVSRSTLKPEGETRVRIEEIDAEFITHDHLTLEMLNLSRKAAQFNSPILIVGETGTGKELIARYIHARSQRKGLFVRLNCASIPKDILEGELFGYKKGAFTGAVRDYDGKIALSDRGTLFLDEIGELPLEIQAKLLHVLEIPEYYPIGSNEKRSVDLHLIAATNRNLRRMVDEGQFRRDLYYRIAVIPIHIPPLRERRCDILPLVEYFMSQKGCNCILSPEVKLKLIEYSWPGNVRELFNVLERSILMSGKDGVIEDVIIDVENSLSSGVLTDKLVLDVPESWEEFKNFKSRAVRERKEELERMFIEKLLLRNNGNISRSARAAGVDRRQFQEMIKELGIDASIFKKPT
jgi:DNA-binding NtrC family response regulator